MENENILKTGTMKKLFIQMCVPSIVIMLVIVIYNMADIFFIGQTGDLNQIAAISLAAPIFSIFQGIGTLLGSGGSIAISIAIGKKDISKIKHITSFCCYISILLGLILTVFFNIFIVQIIDWLGSTSANMEYTILYVRIISIGTIPILFANIFTNLIRADGSAKESMIANALGTFLNIVLDPILILTFNMGVKGAAIATVIGNVATCVYLIWYMGKKQHMFSLKTKDFTMKLNIPKDVISLGIPLALSTLLMSFSNVFVNNLLGGYGDVIIAANGVSSKIGMLLSMVAMGICMGIQPAISYCYGANNFKRMTKIIKSTASLTFLVGCILTIVCFLLRNQIITSFINEPQLIKHGQVMIIASIIIGPIYGIFQLSSTFLQATHKVSYATFVSILPKALIYIPTMLIMNYVWGLTGLIFSTTVAHILSTFLGGFLAMKWYKTISHSSTKEIERKAENDLVSTKTVLN